MPHGLPELPDLAEAVEDIRSEDLATWPCSLQPASSYPAED